jgi:hypothetical protein
MGVDGYGIVGCINLLITIYAGNVSSCGMGLRIIVAEVGGSQNFL